jgi:hypothetical protein
MLLEVWKLVGNFLPVNLAGFREKLAPSTKSTTTTATTKIALYSCYLFSKNKFIPCCDDECCESVENLRKPLRRQLVVSELFCAFNVCISDISGKLVAEQACGGFHPQDATEYPRHFQSFCTMVNLNNGAAGLISLSL